MSNTIMIVIIAHQSGHLSSGQIRAERSHNLALGQTKPAFEDLRLQQQAEMKRMINCQCCWSQGGERREIEEQTSFPT